jgi:membrane protease YdiL (CAAX protease family)
MDVAARVPDNPFERLRLRGLFVWLLVFGIPLLLAVLLIRGQLPWHLTRLDTMLLWTDSLNVIAFAWLLRRRRHVGLRLSRVVGPARLSWLPAGLLCLVPLYVLLFCVDVARVETACRIVPADCQSMQAASSRLSPVLEIFSFVVVGPITEELFFRGILLHRIAARRGLVRGIVGSCVVFGIAHAHHAPTAFLVGLILTLIYIRTASLWVPGACHAAYNAAVIVHERFVHFGGLSFPLTRYQKGSVGMVIIVAWLAVVGTVWLLWPRPGEPLPYQRNAREPSTESQPGGDDAWLKSG